MYSIEYHNDGYLSIAGTRCGTWCLIIVLVGDCERRHDCGMRQHMEVSTMVT